MLRKILLLVLVLASFPGYATHLRSGEISYQSVPGQPNTFLITFTIYTNASAGIVADINTLPVNMGDGMSYTLTRQNGPSGNNNQIPPVFCTHLGELVTPIIRKNIFTITHTYSGNGSYIISTAPSARNAGIVNIANSTGYPMYIESMLTVGISPMNSPVLTFPPIDDGCLNYLYKINPGAIDPDGDVLRFELVRSKTSNGVDIPSYEYPNELGPYSLFSMDPRTGVITWDKPTIQGEYNIAFRIEKYRNGVLVGYVIRDMQVTVAPCLNNPPEIDPVPDICVLAGTTITYKITSHDPENDSLTFETTGSPYLVAVNPATYTPDNMPVGSTSGTFKWVTLPAHFSKNPYQVYYRVTDSHPGASSLTDVVSNFITLIAPKVKNVLAAVNQIQHGFNVRWDKTVSPQAIGYNIYRKQGPSTFPFDSCTLGIPANSGFILVGTVNNPNTLTFVDSNKGHGLASGYIYCYIVTAVFDGGAESAPSDPYCAPLMIPFIQVIQNSLTQCVGNTVQIDSTIVKFEGTDTQTIYKWTASNALQLINADKQVASVTMIKPGFQAVKIVSTSGDYTDSATIYFRVYPIPSPLIKIVDLGGIPDSVMFYNRSSFDVSAEWLFPNGTRSSSMDSVLYVFDRNGFFRVYLKVYNSLGCPDTTSVLHRVTMKGLSMPNAFEPENPSSELNTFRPKALGLKTFFMGVWDLWGNLIWSTDKVDQYQEPLEGWNGNDSKGRKMPSQNYIWRMNATFIDGTAWKGVKDRFGRYHKEGSLTLLR